MKKVGRFILRILIIIGFFVIISIFQSVLEFRIHNEPVVLLLTYLTGFILVLIFFHEKLKLKKIKNFWKYLGIIVVCYLLTVISTSIISSIFNITSANEDMNEQLILSYPIISFFIVGLFAPFYEEILFRLNFKDLFNKKWPFVIVTGIMFGATHLLSATSLAEVLFVIPYSIMGMGLSYIYYDSDNIYTSMLFHSINNIYVLLLLLIGR